MKYLPHTVPELIEQLEESFPPQCIAEGESEVMAHRYAGKVELIGYLRDKLTSTEKKELARNMKA